MLQILSVSQHISFELSNVGGILKNVEEFSMESEKWCSPSLTVLQLFVFFSERTTQTPPSDPIN